MYMYYYWRLDALRSCTTPTHQLCCHGNQTSNWSSKIWLVSINWSSTNDITVVLNTTKVLSIHVITVISLVSRFSGLPHPPAILIATCLECMAVMAERQPIEVWSQLGRTGYLPQVIGNVEQTLRYKYICLIVWVSLSLTHTQSSSFSWSLWSPSQCLGESPRPLSHYYRNAPSLALYSQVTW